MIPVTTGRLTVRKVFEMESGPPLAAILPGVGAEDLQRLARWHQDPAFGATPERSTFLMSMHSYVLQLDGVTILIDTCNGNGKHRSIADVNNADTPFLANLAAAGVSPERIDLVLCTHLHFDHVGWNTRLEGGRWVPTFPNARYLFSRREFELFAAREQEDDHQRAFRDSVVPVYDAGRAELIDPDRVVHREIGNGIWLDPSPGHSPGHCSVLAEAGGERALFWGDVVHHPLQLVRPDLPMVFDEDVPRARDTRLRTLAMAADEALLCFPAHFRASSVGRVRRDRDAFRYEFLS